MTIDPRKYIEVDKRFPATMVGDANRVVTVKPDESGYEHSGAITVEHVVGSIIMWPLDTPPTGYLLCDGVEHDIATYPELGALLGENAPGSGKFNTPDISFAKNSKGQNTGTKEAAKVGEHNHIASPHGKHDHNIKMTSQGSHGHGCGSGGNHRHVVIPDYRTGKQVQAGGGTWVIGTGQLNTNTTYAGDHSHSIHSGGAHTHTPDMQMSGEHDHKISLHGQGEESQPSCTLINFCIRT